MLGCNSLSSLACQTTGAFTHSAELRVIVIVDYGLFTARLYAVVVDLEADIVSYSHYIVIISA